MEWQGALTIYGACVGTLAALTAGWSIWAIVRDRGRLKLELQLRRFELNEAREFIEKPLDSLKGIELHLTMVNDGRRPIRPDSWEGSGLALPHSRQAHRHSLLDLVLHCYMLERIETFSPIAVQKLRGSGLALPHS